MMSRGVKQEESWRTTKDITPLIRSWRVCSMGHDAASLSRGSNTIQNEEDSMKKRLRRVKNHIALINM
ncbi:hypothetical protein DPMN_022321 [Dreissena polymorpha]|uniref:Uncharacterized protein n=1 Tax=Dreissena polymorpha TaxID=45954 RepID=A0A9D4NNP9_DREPO|nr:hypothetical protein DPMN_022321 [Dreissena polymorpha]